MPDADKNLHANHVDSHPRAFSFLSSEKVMIPFPHRHRSREHQTHAVVSFEENWVQLLPSQVEDGTSYAIKGRVMTKEPLVAWKIGKSGVSTVSVVFLFQELHKVMGCSTLLRASSSKHNLAWCQGPGRKAGRIKGLSYYVSYDRITSWVPPKAPERPWCFRKDGVYTQTHKRVCRISTYML